jgi:adenosylcobinamide kinase/adenosylcobinamide-phosphate guanylyltransferase
MTDAPKVTLVLGGARSGKSAYAQELALGHAGPALFVATGVPVDAEMEQRIAAHRAARPESWQCVEAPTGVGEAIRAARGHFDVVLVDCFSFLVSNCLLAEESATGSCPAEHVIWPRVETEVGDMLEAVRSRERPLIVVSAEVGSSVVPEYPLGRVYRDVLGRTNQQLAREADAVYLLVAGIPLAIKSPDIRPPSLER